MNKNYHSVIPCFFIAVYLCEKDISSRIMFFFVSLVKNRLLTPKKKVKILHIIYLIFVPLHPRFF